MHIGQKTEQNGHTGLWTLQHLHDSFLTGIFVGKVEQFIAKCLEKDHAQRWMMLFDFLRCGGRGTYIVTCASFSAPTSDLLLVLIILRI